MDQNSYRSWPDWEAVVASSELFGDMDSGDLQEIGTSMQRVTVSEQRALFLQGDAGDALYVVVTGQLRAVIAQEDDADQIVGYIGPGEPVGEMAILTGEARAASVYACEKTDLIKLPKPAFDRLAEANPRLLHPIAKAIQRRLRRNKLFDMLPHLFGTLDLPLLRDIETELEWVEIERGQLLLRQDDAGDSFYVLVTGHLLAVVDDGAGNEQTIGEISPGESVGEMSILTGNALSASVYAARDSELVKFSKDTFDRLASKHPALLANLAQLVISRLQRAIRISPQPKHHRVTARDIVLVPAGPQVPLADFALRLTDLLRSMGSTLALDGTSFDAHLGRPGASQISGDDPDHPRLVAWLNSQETRYKYILYQTDFCPTNWTRRCLRQADYVLIVGNADADSTPGPIETDLLHAMCQGRAGARQCLVLLHPNGHQQPEGTRTWLEARGVERHFHVRWDTPGDFERLTRFVVGRAVGVVLSGGGARGFAHIGVIRALKEAGIPIDIIGGNSMGACIGAEYAVGYDHAAMLGENRRWVQVVRDVPTLPLMAASNGRKRARLIKGLLGESCIEDLWLPYFCVSSSLTHAELVVHRSGSLYKSVLASGALAGIVPPVELDGRLLVDGTYLNDLPVDVLYELCDGGTVIAADVCPPSHMVSSPPLGDSVSGWALLWKKINPFLDAKKVPDIVTLVQRANELGSLRERSHRLEQGYADLYLSPPASHVGIFDFGTIDRVAELGYEYARKRIAEWQSST